MVVKEILQGSLTMYKKRNSLSEKCACCYCDYQINCQLHHCICDPQQSQICAIICRKETDEFRGMYFLYHEGFEWAKKLSF
jgi:hypothetical protein